MNRYKLMKFLIVILGFSTFGLNLAYCIKKYFFQSFLHHKIKKNTILISEPNIGHGEVIPGIVKYCLDLGFNVEILVNSHTKAEKPLTMFKNLKVFSFIQKEYIDIIKSIKLNEYHKVIFTSSRVYYDYKHFHERFLFDYISDNKINNNKILFIEHHLELLTENQKKEYDFAGLPEFCENYGIKMINPHYFGTYKIKKKHKKTKFVVAGAIQTKRKNHNILIDAINKLLNKGINDFEITVIGNGKLEVIDEKIKKKIKFTGRLSYDKMYKIIANSDYILGLFDPDNSAHERYIKDGTSGTYQLVYGFLKPLIVNEKFAAPHGLNNYNSIIYDKNNLAEAMKIAINESQTSYLTKISNLKNLKDKIYKTGLNNIKNIVV